jgi:phage FluMu protein Com
MALTQVACPSCGAVLKPAKPIEAGKKIKCPKCTAIFEAKSEKPGVKPTPAKPAPKPLGKAGIQKGKSGAPAPPVDPSKALVEQIGTYAFAAGEAPPQNVDEEDEEYDDDDERKIVYAPDLSIKDPRGPAQARLVRPSNAVIFCGVIGCLVGLLLIGYGVFPLIFSEYRPRGSPSKWLKSQKPGMGDVEKEYKDLTAAERTEIDETDREEMLWHYGAMGVGAWFLLYSSVIAVGGVKMQSLESYRWAMTASIMAILPLHPAAGIAIGIMIGIWALTMLRDKKVRAGFEYVAD